jgi:hypothetical protein
VIICPCCGFKFEGDLREGCKGCGARSVGDPLPKPEHELPAYGRSLLLVVASTVMVFGFLAQTIIALVKKVPVSLGFWDWIAAGETAAWQLKWIAIPITLVVLFGGRRIYRSMMQTPARFVGLTVARRSLLASVFAGVLMVTLIGMTVPSRVRQRQMRFEAGMKAQAYTLARAQLEYQALHGAVATLTKDLSELPDPDGSIAAALNNVDPSGYKTHGADVAVAKPTQRNMSGVVIRNASVSTANEDPPVGGLPTNYEFRLPGEDGIQDTDDDLILRDGIILTVAEAKETIRPAAAAATATRPRKP